ncbi:MAG TPA: hypothetical protein VFG83_12885 [Kofleriaceae bacterium]|nr:hypothetical protein [Kofleriaceae bacterium]
MTVTLRNLAVAPGRFTRSQEDLSADFRAEIHALEKSDNLAATAGFVFGRSGIDQRHFELDPRELSGRSDWILAVNDATYSMAHRALRAAFHQDGELSPGDVDALIVASSTYTGFPSQGRRLQDGLDFPQEALVYDLTGLGCAAPTHAWHLADMLLTTGRARRVCVVCADAMGTHSVLRHHRVLPTLSQLVAHCLASDGGAAMILERGDAGSGLLHYETAALRARLWRGSLGENDLTADADNQPFMAVGKNIRTRLSEVEDAFDDDRWANEPLFMHPGGAALMEIIRERHPSLASAVALSSAMLADNGNVGAPSALWVLHQAFAQKAAMTPRMRLFALGPGIVTTVLTLDGVTKTE